MTEVGKTPWHLWVVGVLAVLVNAFPVVDFTLTNVENEFWLSPLTSDQRVFILGAPLWADVCWALGGFGAFIGSVLLLLRSRHAVTAYIVSIAGLAGSTLYQHILNGETTRALFQNVAMIVTAVIWVIMLALFFYARAMKAKGVLR
ncbi:hypothetical protein [Sphingopyxis alaskensis]|jgi:hypothetical protein|uniref:Transmembrane protein n=1 Tax=Sphingopyxis alaskensis (strain DSM 13593 / LMG 18877 / RB2256) TaxID=317655 RepID=Q1GWI0_SPHAL|nr:hypothetical protein [Sphingopyxis alaskensis]ABF51992.1 hypothetical protein Sala_0269 [Sphingopyxis alaskensis RB2256]MCM3419316.1 hypothetical protein [Sphingopyxis alaskensis]